MKKKALIFDMDGTMVDNMMVHHHAWQSKLAEVGKELTLDEVIATCHGMNDDILVRIFGDQYAFEERDRISAEKEARYREIFLEQLRLIDGLPELLARAAELDIPMGIGTAARYENVDYVLDNLNIRHYFKAIVCDRDVKKGKPDPSVFFQVAQTLGVEPEECLVFEDSPTGARTAFNAGMEAIILTTTHKAEEFETFTSVRKCVKDYTELDLEEELAK
ncbi:beta-phosphoglucomutase [Siphonobacter sp. BAB-5385]|uniref:HAD family hydrolase n=1 Tax=unclassified Siphonobacter TaxID=2635712 RepID=UPI000B9E4486|nr:MULTISPECIES: HAD family phosphatase [unclassified Siphonobacter]OZI08389.1 beta-phosphoglucomutase [Siphonobacter sp. BAB-5385]PMD96529.1 beta-phosphoglucomutase [Siphonobacter sp. BAB-5405]